jgi:hypothetical protein
MGPRSQCERGVHGGGGSSEAQRSSSSRAAQARRRWLERGTVAAARARHGTAAAAQARRGGGSSSDAWRGTVEHGGGGSSDAHHGGAQCVGIVLIPVVARVRHDGGATGRLHPNVLEHLPRLLASRASSPRLRTMGRAAS